MGHLAFKGQVAAITGASSGIGAELARQLGAAGSKVALLALPDDSLHATAATITGAGGSARAFAVDVADRAAVHVALESVARELGPIDLLILCAGIGRVTAVESFSALHLEEMVRVNLLGMSYAIEAVLPSMLQRRSGHLVGVSSLSSVRGQPLFSGYCASKAAVSTLLEGLRIELRGHGVSVTTVRPGFVRTPMTASFKSARFMIDVGPAARIILEGISRRRADVNFPWQSAVLSAISRWMPNRVYDRVTAKVMATVKANLADDVQR